MANFLNFLARIARPTDGGPDFLEPASQKRWAHDTTDLGA